MTELNDTTSIDDLLDATLDDLEDLPEFKAFPVGAHRVSISLELKEVNDKQAIELSMKAMETLELAHPAKDEPLKEGDTGNMLFFLDNEFARGSLKKITTPLAEALGTSTIRDLIEECKGVECVVATSLKKNKEDPDSPYMNIKELNVV